MFCSHEYALILNESELVLFTQMKDLIKLTMRMIKFSFMISITTFNIESIDLNIYYRYFL